MCPLDKSLRNKLERTIKAARDIAEAAARSSLEQLGVGEASPFTHLSEDERDLRRKLRAHGRQLGDSLNVGKAQSMDWLLEEMAYEHWHRMLFARFLAENNLLMYEGVPVTLTECAELAADEGLSGEWELAATLAAAMLPQIFGTDSVVFALHFSPEYQQKLERLVADLPLEVFTASDSLGWVYQFWQAKKKDEINHSGVKIGARELPAVTQLFTEPYMVAFLLDNSLGAWWASRLLSEADLKNASSEAELRSKAGIPGVPLEYLRFVRQDDGVWTPAAGTFDAWPESLSELKVLDPCCGSGHFLVAAFLMLVPMRMELEGLSARDAVDRVLAENIHGLELDQRCVELAAFALALTAWKYPDAGGYRLLPELNVACSGLSVKAAKDEWQKLALDKHDLRIALNWLFDTFKDAPVLGSLLNPAGTEAAKLVEWRALAQALEQALATEQSDEQHEAAVTAQGLAKATTLLAGQYHWVVTNVPYRGRGDHGDILRDFCERHYPAAKNELATVFLERCLELCVRGGTASVVLPQNWLFLTSYKKVREKLLKADTWRLIARLGPKAFQTPMWDFNVQLIILDSGNSGLHCDGLFANLGQSGLIRGLDVSHERTAGAKAVALPTAEIKTMEQVKQLDNPDARVALDEGAGGELLENNAYGFQGISSADYPRFGRNFWELSVIDGQDWIFQQSTVKSTQFFGGRAYVLFWERGKGALVSSKAAAVRGRAAWQSWGVAVGQMCEIPVTLHMHTAFDTNTAALIPHNPTHLPAIWCFCSSPEYNIAVRQIDQSLKVTNATLVKIPFNLDLWSKVAEDKYPHGLPKPYSDDPTQWIFHGHPSGSVVWDEDKRWTADGELRVDDTVLQTAAARLLGYRWPAELDCEMELADEQREWVRKTESLHAFADQDGIVCIPSVRGEASASDRLFEMLVAAYGEAWTNDTMSQLLEQVDHAGKTLEIWLREKFFVQHCKLFSNRPFIWHIWDGLNDGFAVLVNYHRLDAKLLETLIYSYLGDWISRQKQDIAEGVDGAQEKLAAAESLKAKLELILEGEAPYDIFVRWKPIEKQPIGWEPDLDDGVRLNIRPFLSVPDVGRKGTGVLRDKPNIKWGKDRGKDVESAPWYHLFAGDRINDHHLSLAEKRAAREAAK